MFRAGQKVCCVDVDGAQMLTLHGVYTIKWISPPSIVKWRGVVQINGRAVGLFEITPDPRFMGFAPERFRPINEKETDISVFKAILTKRKVDA